MCGRYTKAAETLAIEKRFGLEPSGLSSPPRYNIAPGQAAPVIIMEQGPRLREMSWGLLPSWVQDPRRTARPINARGESLALKPFFKNAYRRRRCLIPADGFYEWKRGARGRSGAPHFFSLANGGLFALAGLYELWQPAGEGLPQYSFTIITTRANGLVGRLHQRMPVILNRERESAWLDQGLEDSGELAQMLQPYPREEMKSQPVSPAVNSVANEGPELLEPAPEERNLFGD